MKTEYAVRVFLVKGFREGVFKGTTPMCFFLRMFSGVMPDI